MRKKPDLEHPGAHFRDFHPRARADSGGERCARTERGAVEAHHQRGDDDSPPTPPFTAYQPNPENLPAAASENVR